MRKFGETSEKDDQVTPAADWFVAFDGCRFKPRTGELWQASGMVRLPPRTADVLALLAERPQELVTKEELFARVWQGRVVGDESLTTCIRELRRALEDDARKPRYIETCHRRGYRLIVPATRSAAGGQVTPTLPSFDKPSIAVLPFRNLSRDARQESLVEGIAEDIATALSHCAELAVIAYSSAASLAKENVEPAEAARQLGVRYLLTGSVRRGSGGRGGGRARVSARLLDAASGEQIWAERYDSDLRDILILQDDISSQIVATIAPWVIRAEERRVGRLPGNGLRAYELALLARALACEYDGAAATVMETRHREALRHAQRAVTLDPESPSAYAALALAHACLPEHLYFRPDYAHALDKAAAAAAELRRLDPANYVAYSVAGKVCLRRVQAHEALANLRRAHELNSNDCDVLRWLAWAEVNLGLGVEAHEHCALALRLSPRDPRRYLIYWGLAWAAFVSGNAAEGVEWANKSIEDAPAFFPSYTILAACLAETGEMDAAQHALSHLLQHRPEYIRSRLAGKNYFGLPELADRFTMALCKAAGRLVDGKQLTFCRASPGR